MSEITTFDVFKPKIMTSLTVTLPSKTSSIAKAEQLMHISKGKAKSSKSLGNIKTYSVVPITDIREKYASKSTASNDIGENIVLTTTPTAQETKKCSTSMRMRESKIGTEQNTENSKVLNTQNANVRGNSEGKIVHVVDLLQKFSCQDTDENSPTGSVSREKKVIQDSQQKNALKKAHKHDLSFVRKQQINSKTDANGQHENHLDTGTDLGDSAFKNCNCVEGNDYKVEELVKKCDGITMNGAEGGVTIESDDRSKENTSTTNTTEAVATPVRPVTLVTGNNGFSSATQTSPIPKSTPKTPNSSPQHFEPSQPKSALHNSIHRKHQHILPEVPRTTNIRLTPKTPPVTPDSPATYLDDDLDSIYSFATTTSGRSTMSCEHSYVAHNGTTFSGRKNKFVIHNSQYAGLVGSAYVTPTQRAQNQIRKLKALLHAMQQDINQKNDEILRLTREVAELRLFKASLNSPEERSASSDAVTVREAELLQTSQDVSPIVDMVDDASKSSPRHMANTSELAHSNNYQSYLQQQQNAMQHSSDMQSSFADSGHFEDMTSMSVHSKDSYAANTHDGSDEDAGTAARAGDVVNAVAAAEREVEVQRQELIRMYEQRIEELIRNQDAASTEMKRIHNDKVEALLQKLSECNTRYADIVPDYEMAKERIRELESQLEDLQRKLFEHEEKQNKMYLHMYQKGQEAERIARADQALELAYRAPDNRVSINELLHQLQSTQEELENIRAAEYRNECGSNHALLTAKEAISLWVLGARKTIYRRLLEAQKNHTQVDPEVTLQFLKSAVYYFLTDNENSQGHLQAIESILEFTEAEKLNINKARTAK